MSLLVVGTDGPVAQALGSAAPLSGVDEAVRAMQEQRPDAVAVVALPASARDVFAKMKKRVTPELGWRCMKR